MKNQIKKIAITACFALTYAQIAPANVPPPPAAPGELPLSPADRHPRRPERGGELKTLTSVTGKITGYLTNDRYIYNAFTLQSGSQSVTVRFPEQMGQTLMNAAKKGETVSVKGFTDNGPDGVSSFQLVSVTAGNTHIFDTPPPVPVQPVIAEAKTYTGSISDFKRDLSGGINGLNLDNKIQVDLPPHASVQLQTILKTGDKIEVSGFKDTPPAGVVLTANAPTIIHPQTITISGQTYLLR